MKYHKIETLYVRDEKTHKVNPGELKNRTYSLLKEWVWTEKIDGTNIRCIWDPVGAIERSGLPLRFAGKSDEAQIHPELFEWLGGNVLTDKLLQVFPDVPVILYGEGYGAGIQKGGAYSQEKKFILFDVLVDNKWWLSRENMEDVASKLGLEPVPYLGTFPLKHASNIVRDGFQSNVGNCQAEGMVGRPAETLFDKKGARLITKLKTKDF